MKIIKVKTLIQWLLEHSQYCATIITIHVHKMPPELVIPKDLRPFFLPPMPVPIISGIPQ